MAHGIRMRRGRLRCGLAAAVFSCALAPGTLRASPADLCDSAARRAAAQSGVPLSVLQAISLTETGRKLDGAFRPWAWTVNMEGKGVWFDDQESARAYVKLHLARGARSFDVGCFQLNYKWHGHNFTSIEQMFEPEANALYAARFLTDLYRELGDWTRAAGAYHSRTKKYADRYAARFETLRARISGSEAAVPAAPAPLAATMPPREIRINRFPLLQAGRGGRGMGSLVPLTQGGPGLFATRGDQG